MHKMRRMTSNRRGVEAQRARRRTHQFGLAENIYADRERLERDGRPRKILGIRYVNVYNPQRDGSLAPGNRLKPSLVRRTEKGTEASYCMLVRCVFCMLRKWSRE